MMKPCGAKNLVGPGPKRLKKVEKGRKSEYSWSQGSLVMRNDMQIMHGILTWDVHMTM
jgi:hypothetical protein